MTNFFNVSVTQKEQNDHRQATRDDYLEVKVLYLHTWHPAGTVPAFEIPTAPSYAVFPPWTQQSYFRAVKVCSVILPHSSLRRQHPEVSAVGGTCMGDRPANRTHNWIKNPVVFNPPVLASGPFRWAPEMRRMRGRPTCCRRCWQFNPAPLGECWLRLFQWWRGVCACVCIESIDRHSALNLKVRHTKAGQEQTMQPPMIHWFQWRY